MRLGFMYGYSGAHISIDMDIIHEVERLGYDSVWSAEAWGSDAITPLAFIAAQTSKIKLGTAIMQIPGRTPGNAAMVSMTMDALSGGRFICGVGTSGPQVVEGWHGVPFKKPMTWTREYITILREIFKREKPLEFQGEHYQIPYRGPDATGMGKPLKSILYSRPDIPIYTGSMAPKGQEQAAEIADGCLMTCMNPDRFDVIDENFQRGFAKTGGRKSYENFDVAPNVIVVVGDDLDMCRAPVKMMHALYIGGMGPRTKNFYAQYMERVGFAEEANRIQDLFLAGKKAEAAAAVTDEMVDTLNLVGPPERIRERFQEWKKRPIGTMIVAAKQLEAVRLMAELAL